MAHQTFFKSDMRTSLDESIESDKAAAKAWRSLCADVNTRDRHRCRACKRAVTFTMAKKPNRGEHHHVVPRSLGGADSSGNIALLCLQDHQERHVKRTLLITGDANGMLRFQRGDSVWFG